MRSKFDQFITSTVNSGKAQTIESITEKVFWFTLGWAVAVAVGVDEVMTEMAESEPESTEVTRGQGEPNKFSGY